MTEPKAYKAATPEEIAVYIEEGKKLRAQAMREMFYGAFKALGFSKSEPVKTVKLRNTQAA